MFTESHKYHINYTCNRIAAALLHCADALHCHHRAWYDVVTYTQAWLNSKMTWLRENSVGWMSDSWLIPRRCSNHVVCVF